jgi:hypothetical protein
MMACLVLGEAKWQFDVRLSRESLPNGFGGGVYGAGEGCCAGFGGLYWGAGFGIDFAAGAVYSLALKVWR